MYKTVENNLIFEIQDGFGIGTLDKDYGNSYCPKLPEQNNLRFSPRPRQFQFLLTKIVRFNY